MEGPQPGENPDNEYMAMDSDQWEDQDDTYENGDTLDTGRGQVLTVPGAATQLTNKTSRQSNDTPNLPQINSPTLPRRYMTLRWPVPNGNVGSAKTEQLVFFQRSMVGLGLLCLLLLLVVLGLSIACDLLAGSHKLLDKQLEGIDDILKGMQCGLKYYISNAENQTYYSELYVSNCEMFMETIRQKSFVLHLKNDSCKNSWECEC